MRLIGLTGGIASGKSAVAARLREHGAIVIDADQVAREVVEPGEPALLEIQERFGDAVIDAGGRLDRPALGAIVFGDPEARRALEAITHPAIGRRTRERIARAQAADPEAIVVYDVPLLVESAPEGRLRFDHVVVVQAAVEERIRRMVELRGMRREEAERRIASQADDAARLAIADTVIDADGTLEETLARVDAAWPVISALP
ncbi:dephospho-CoA kinase [Homoserinibacter sp. YIM 151385]|uniref:dephospho-CoA kinase n=1 Tax=Homoserinibacter sp. YIM 151385 TaxID=2985506 RepID=UPI0022F0B592|nr:dephospho-CoA kinase [Homoserinibacter sp. YIM 151385]WBU38615.1 dephospho-CoA kinase [Homoserinibacter sp. YIM 151385]